MRAGSIYRKAGGMNDPAQMELSFSDRISEATHSFATCKGMAKGLAETVADPNARLHLAKAFCGSALKRYWQEVCKRHRCPWEIRVPPVSLDLTDEPTFSLAQAAGDAAATFPILQAGYLISWLMASLPTWLSDGSGPEASSAS